MTEIKLNLLTKKRFFCNSCRRTTNHFLKDWNFNIDYEQDDGWWEGSISLFWICAGCESAALEVGYTWDGHLDLNNNQIYEHINFAPKRSQHNVDQKQFRQLPSKLDKIYRETLVAFNDELEILCAVGLRALLEGICADKKIAGKTFEQKINNLIGLLPENIVSSLHGFRFIGNTAVHELNPPEKDDLRLAIEISEDLLNFLYELDYKTSRLPKHIKPPQKGD